MKNIYNEVGLGNQKYKGQKESNMKHNLLASQYYMNVRKLVLMSCTIFLLKVEVFQKKMMAYDLAGKLIGSLDI